MLSLLRDKKIKKTIWIILCILVLPSFLFWGIATSVRSKDNKGSGVVGKIAGRSISVPDFKDSFEAVRNNAIMQFGEDLNEIQKYINFEEQAWERLVILNEARKRKLKATDKEVIETIQNYPFFKRKEQFDQRTYEDMLRYVFHTQPRIFEEQTRQNILIAKLFEAATAAVKVSDEEVRNKYVEENEQISVQYIASIPHDFAPKDNSIDEKEMKDYYSANSLQFKRPPSFNVEYIALDSEEKTKSLLPYLENKDKLNELLKQMNLTIKETGLFPENSPIPEIGWAPQIANIISKAKVGVFLTPVQFNKTFYILKLKEKKDSFIPEFDTVKDLIKQKLIQQKSDEAAKSKITACLEKLKQNYQNDPKSADFDAAAKEFGLKSSATDLFKYQSYLEGIGSSDEFWKTGKILKESEFSDVISLPSGYYIIKQKSKVGIDEAKYKEESAALTKKALLQKRQEEFGKFVEQLNANAKRFMK